MIKGMVLKSRRGYEGSVELIKREHSKYPYLVRVNNCDWQTTRHETLEEAEGWFSWRSR